LGLKISPLPAAYAPLPEGDAEEVGVVESVPMPLPEGDAEEVGVVESVPLPVPDGDAPVVVSELPEAAALFGAVVVVTSAEAGSVELAVDCSILLLSAGAAELSGADAVPADEGWSEADGADELPPSLLLSL